VNVMKILKILSIVILLLLVVGCTVDPPVGEETEHTPGLIFELNEDGESYKVVGYEGTSEDIVIASTYNALPVTDIRFFSNFNVVGQHCITPNLSIKSITLPDTLTTIHKDAFACTQLLEMESITISRNLTRFAHAILTRYRTEVIIPDNHATLKVINVDGVNIVVTHDEKELIFVPFSENETKVVSLPNTIEIISPYALHNTNYQEVILPNSLKVIGERAFYNTKQLRLNSTPTKISNLGDQVTHIGERAFSFGYGGTTELVLPKNLQELGKYAFTFNTINSIVVNGPLYQYNAFTLDILDSTTGLGNEITSFEFKEFTPSQNELDLFTYQFVYQNFLGKSQTITVILPSNQEEAQNCQKAIELSIQIANLRKRHYENLPTFIFESSNDS